MPFTTCDFPGHLAAVIFCQGCPWRCLYCHNSHLQAARSGSIEWTSVLDTLSQRVGLLDGVVFSGGEPTEQNELGEAMKQVKALGYMIGLHTAAPKLARLEAILHEVDWVGLDIKALAKDYPRVTRVAGSGADAFAAIRLLQNAGKQFEVRTTVHGKLIDARSLQALGRKLRDLGVTNYVVQTYRSQGNTDSVLTDEDGSSLDIEVMEECDRLFESFSIRN